MQFLLLGLKANHVVDNRVLVGASAFGVPDDGPPELLDPFVSHDGAVPPFVQAADHPDVSQLRPKNSTGRRDLRVAKVSKERTALTKLPLGEVGQASDSRAEYAGVGMPRPWAKYCLRYSRRRKARSRRDLR